MRVTMMDIYTSGDELTAEAERFGIVRWCYLGRCKIKLRRSDKEIRAMIEDVLESRRIVFIGPRGREPVLKGIKYR